MVVVEILGVIKLVPVPSEEPPIAAAYQLIVPALAVAPNATVPGPQLELGVVPEMVGTVFTDIVMLSDEAVVVARQLPSDTVMSQVTASLLANVVEA